MKYADVKCSYDLEHLKKGDPRSLDKSHNKKIYIQIDKIVKGDIDLTETVKQGAGPLTAPNQTIKRYDMRGAKSAQVAS